MTTLVSKYQSGNARGQLPPGVVIDLALLLTPPLFDRRILLHTLETEGYDLVCRSYLGRGTTRRILRENDLLHYFDDLVWSDGSVDSGLYEVSGPLDELFYMISHLTMLYTRGNPLTSRLSFGGKVPLSSQEAQAHAR